MTPGSVTAARGERHAQSVRMTNETLRLDSGMNVPMASCLPTLEEKVAPHRRHARVQPPLYGGLERLQAVLR